MEDRKIILKKYSIKEIYNIPEIMEEEIPFPYNVSIRNNKIQLLSPIELRKEEMKDDSIYWVIKTPNLTLYDYDIKLVIHKWNEHVKNILFEAFKISSYKLFIVFMTLINFIILFILCIILNCPTDIILLNLFGLNLLIIQMYKDSIIKYCTTKDVKSYMDHIISIAQYDYSYYNCKPLFGLTNIIHIDTKIKKPENKSLFQSFIDILEKENKNIRYEKIKIYLNNIKEFTIEINKYYNKDDISIQNEINNLKSLNNKILDIIKIIKNHPDKEMIYDIENILDDYLNIYRYYLNSLSEASNFTDKIKLKVIKEDAKIQNDYLKIMKK